MLESYSELKLTILNETTLFLTAIFFRFKPFEMCPSTKICVKKKSNFLQGYLWGYTVEYLVDSHLFYFLNNDRYR